jgi:hypothetical protein
MSTTPTEMKNENTEVKPSLIEQKEKLYFQILKKNGIPSDARYLKVRNALRKLANAILPESSEAAFALHYLEEKRYSDCDCFARSQARKMAEVHWNRLHHFYHNKEAIREQYTKPGLMEKWDHHSQTASEIYTNIIMSGFIALMMIIVFGP